MKVAFCTMEKFDNRLRDSVGSSRIRGSWLIRYWPEAEEFIIAKKYDVIIFQKVYWSQMMDNFEGIKILDICDPDWVEGKPVLEYVDKADATVVSTPALRDYMVKFRPDSKIICIPDRIDLEEHDKYKKVKHTGIAQTVAWFGYSHNIHYIYKTFEYLIPKGLKLVVISDQPFNPPVQYQGLKFENIPYAYPGVHKEIVKCDMLLMPESNDDLRGRFKSNNKTLTGWALGVPVVQVPADIDRFMDPIERQKEADLRYAEIKDKWDVRQSVREYQELIVEIVKNRANKVNEKPKEAVE